MEKEKRLNWREIYRDPELGKRIGLEILEKLKKDGHAQTHDGLYHTDDIFCMSLINICLGEDNEVEFVRTREKTSYFTFDVGGGDFDHHHCDEYRKSLDGIFASFGKLWCTLGRTLELREEVWKEIDNQFVRYIDASDNIGKMNPINYAINATRYYGTEEDKGLLSARIIADKILEDIIESGFRKSKEIDKFYEECDNIEDNVLYLSRHYTIPREVYKSLGIEWIIFPDLSTSGFIIQAVGKKILPIELPEDVTLIHKGRWIGRSRTLESAKKLVAEV